MGFSLVETSWVTGGHPAHKKFVLLTPQRSVLEAGGGTGQQGTS